MTRISCKTVKPRASEKIEFTQEDNWTARYLNYEKLPLSTVAVERNATRGTDNYFFTKKPTHLYHN